MEIMESMNVTVSLRPMAPYVNFKLENGLPRPDGCLGDIWVLLAKLLKLNCTYTLFGQDHHADVILQGAVNQLPVATQLAIVSSWYDIHMEESLASSISLSYLNNWSFQHWYSTIAMGIIFTYTLYFMLHCAEKNNLNIETTEEENKLIRKSQWRRHEIRLNLEKNKGDLINLEALEVHNDIGILNCVMASVGLFSNQGISLQTKLYAIRLLIVSFLLFGMIMTNAYSAMLVSQLTAGSDVGRELAERDSLIICMRFNSVPYFAYDGPRNRIKVENSCAKSLCSGNAVLETPELVELYGIPCKVLVMRKRQYQFKIAVEVMPQAPDHLKNLLQLSICRLREAGILSRFTRKWLLRPDTYSTRGNFHQVSFFQVENVFSWYFISIMWSFIILILEIIFSKRNSFQRHFFTLND